MVCIGYVLHFCSVFESLIVLWLYHLQNIDNIILDYIYHLSKQFHHNKRKSFAWKVNVPDLQYITRLCMQLYPWSIISSKLSVGKVESFPLHRVAKSVSVLPISSHFVKYIKYSHTEAK